MASSPDSAEPRARLEDKFDNEADDDKRMEAAGGGGSETANDKDDDDNEDEEAEEEGEDDDDDDDGGGDKMGAGKEVSLGGPIDTPAFGLLDGIFEDPETGSHTRVTIPLTRLPATLGRSHDTDDPLFFGLGKKKALSRKQCMIYYRDIQGGRVEWDNKEGDLVYVKPTGEGEKSDKDDLPKRGFFVIECLGKNRILVNKERVDQGNWARIESGTPIRISSYMLYFLLPTDATSKEHFIPSKKRKSAPVGPITTKSMDPAPVSSNASVASNSKAGDAPPLKKAKTTMGANFQAELDALPVENLLEQMTEAINNNEWERRHQLIGSTISMHAVRHAATDPEIQAKALDGGVSRSAIMAWIEDSDMYSDWVRQMLTKMEARSYQAAITKSLLKAGFVRTGTSGRYIKWLLPPDIKIITDAPAKKEKKSKKGEGQEDEEEEDDDEGGEEENEEDDEGGNAADDNGDDSDNDGSNDGGKPEGHAGARQSSEEDESGSELERGGGGGGGAVGGDDDDEDDVDED